MVGNVADDRGNLCFAKAVAIDLAPHEFEAGRAPCLGDLHYRPFGQAKAAKCLLTQADLAIADDLPVVDQSQRRQDLAVLASYPDLAKGLEMLG